MGRYCTGDVRTRPFYGLCSAAGSAGELKAFLAGSVYFLNSQISRLSTTLTMMEVVIGK